jgi:SAM-dependent methyltransferase
VTDRHPDDLVEEQIAYYRARAPEYDDWWLRTGRYAPDDEFGRRWEAAKAELDEALAAFAPTGDVLELAAGTGNLTRLLVAQPGVSSVTAVDASEEALAVARTKVPGGVTFEVADVFSWMPPRRYDVVAFGFWLSHVPPGRFADFWQLVDDALAPDGRVHLVDNAVPVEDAASADGRVAETPWSRTWLDRGVAVRTLADGRAFHIVKRTWTPRELEAELAGLGWVATVREHQGLFVSGTVRRAG